MGTDPSDLASRGTEPSVSRSRRARAGGASERSSGPAFCPRPDDLDRVRKRPVCARFGDQDPRCYRSQADSCALWASPPSPTLEPPLGTKLRLWRAGRSPRRSSRARRFKHVAVHHARLHDVRCCRGTPLYLSQWIARASLRTNLVRILVTRPAPGRRRGARSSRRRKRPLHSGARFGAVLNDQTARIDQLFTSVTLSK